MGFEARELSVEDGAPILLAMFAVGGKTWRFARADQVVPVGGHDYLPTPMEATSPRQTAEVTRNGITLTVPWDNPIAALWRRMPPVATIACILKELHAGDNETSNAWQGHVAGVRGTYRASAEIQLLPGIVALRGTGLRRPWQIGCPHVLYDPTTCRVDREDWRTPATLTAKVGLSLTAAAFGSFGAGELVGGYIEWTDDDGVTDWRFITGHTGTTVQISMPAPHLPADADVDVFPGCARDLASCERFGNIPNYGGIPYFARKNPFDGSPLF